MSTFGPSSPDNDAIRQTRDHSKRQVELIEELGTSSKTLEKLTRILILFTVVIIATGLPIAVTAMMSLINPQYATIPRPYVFVGIFIMIVALFIIGIFAVYPQDARNLKSNLLKEPEHTTTGTHAQATISATDHVEVYNPSRFSFEDYRAAVLLVFISGIFLWLSYQLQTLFPSSVSNVMGDLVLSMWILFGASILILIIMIYRTFRN